MALRTRRDLSWLSRNWLLSGLFGAILLAWIYPAAGAAGGLLQTELTTKACVGLVFFIQGLTLPGEQLVRGITSWRLHVFVQCFIFLIFPLFGWLLVLIVGAGWPEDVRTGFLFLAVLPTTISSAVVFTALAGGHTAGAIFNTTVANILAVIVTPLWMSLFLAGGGEGRPLGEAVVEVIKLLVAPLAAGQLVRPLFRDWADRRRQRLSSVSGAVILFIVYAAFCDSFASGVWQTFTPGLTVGIAAGTLILFVATTVAVGGMARVFGFSTEDRLAALFCGPQKSLATGVPMGRILFESHAGLGLILLPLLIYHILQLLIGGMLVSRWRRENKG